MQSRAPAQHLPLSPPSSLVPPLLSAAGRPLLVVKLARSGSGSCNGRVNSSRGRRNNTNCDCIGQRHGKGGASVGRLVSRFKYPSKRAVGERPDAHARVYLRAESEVIMSQLLVSHHQIDLAASAELLICPHTEGKAVG